MSGACIEKGTHPLKDFKTELAAGLLYARWQDAALAHAGVAGAGRQAPYFLA